MRRFAVALVFCGMMIALLGGSAGLVSWTGQATAIPRWDKWEPGPTEVTDTLTRLSFPAQDKEFVVRDGGSRTNLLLGPAHMEWSPDPGEPGNSIIAGHRDTHFRFLKNVRKGDVITVDRGGKRYEYRIVDFEIVRATDDRYYQPTATPILTLVTCYPFYYVGPAPKRFVVRAELLDANS